MGFRVEVLGEFRVIDTSTGSVSAFRRYQEILALLALSPDPVRRADIIRFAWPSADRKSGQNRLRVALAELKKALPGALEVGPEDVSLAAESDANEIRDLIRQADNTVTEAQELHLLTEALQRRPAQALLAWKDISVNLISLLTDASLRAAELGRKLGQLESALGASQFGIQLQQDNAELWILYLKLSWQMGSGESALQAIQGQKNPELIRDPQIREVSMQIRQGKPSSVRTFSTLEQQLVIELFESLAETRPELCRAVLASPQSLPLSGKYPKQMHDILARITGIPETRDEPWERCMARMIGLKAWLNDAPGVLESAPIVLESSRNPIVQRAVWNAVAVAHSLQRDWKSAMSSLDETMRFALQTGEEIDELTVRGNKAYFLMHQAKLDESEAEFEYVLQRLRAIDSTRAQFEIAVAVGSKSFIPIFRRDWAEAAAQLETAIAVRSSGRDSVQMGLIQTALGFARMKQGITEGVFSLIRTGFIDAFASDSERNQQITFEFASAALVQTAQREFAESVLAWTNAWRKRSGLIRSEAEMQLFGNEMKANVRLSDSPIEVGHQLMRRLRKETV